MLVKEEWKSIEGYEGLYEISNLGRVRSHDRVSNGKIRKGRMLKQVITGGGYYHVCLSKNGVFKQCRVHRLVATAFVPNPDAKETVNHINEDKLDNRACNLEWLTLSENVRYGTRSRRAGETLTANIGVPVYQIDLNGFAVIAKFDSLTLAAEAVGAQPGDIWEASKNGGRCKNYRWRRVDSITEHDLLFWKETGKRVFGEKIIVFG